LRRCNEWVNLSAFLARLHAAGVSDQYTHRFKHPYVDISAGLEKETPHRILRDCRILAATMWIVHAGKAIHGDLAKHSTEAWSVGKWSSWAAKLKEIEEDKDGGNDERVTSAVRHATTAMAFSL
jgi:hypothetical protein